MGQTAEVLYDIVESDAQTPEELELTDEEAPEPPITYDETSENMVADLMATKKGQEWVRKCAERVFREVTDARDSQEEYRQNRTEEQRFFNGDLPAKTWPWKNCANPHLPIASTRALRLVFRIYGEAFGDFTEVANVMPVGPDDHEVAEKLTKHLNWQIQTEMSDFPRQMERALQMFIYHGDFTCHSYYDSFRKKCRHDILSVDDFVVPYVYTTTEPDYSDCPWVAKILKMQRHEVQRMRGAWHDVDRVLEGEKPVFDDEPDSPLAETTATTLGMEPEADATRAPYKFIHYEGWIDLPNDVDERFCKVVLEWRSKAVMQIQVMEEDDWKDRIRHRRQSQELQGYRDAEAQYQSALMQPQMPMMDPATGMPAPPPPPPEPPTPPSWADPVSLADPMYEPERPRRVPIHMFTHGVCIEPLTGPLGIGYGKWLTDFNRAANTALAQFTDSATLANIKTFLTPGGMFEKPISLEPGKFNPVKDASTRELKDSVVPLEFGPANPQLIDIVKMMQEAADDVTQAPGILSGEEGKSGETFRGVATRLEQATKQITVVGRKYIRSVEHILRNQARLNAQFLPEEELVYISNHKTANEEELRVGRAMYEDHYRIVIKSGMRFASQAQRIAEADQVLQMPQACPPLQSNLAFFQAAAADALKARDKDHLLPFLGPPAAPQGVQTPMGIPPPPPPGMPPPGAPPPGGPPGAPPPEAGPPPGAPA
jgi:hypothetical protein